jgi:RNA polymerase sigma-70 factor (ECF subfamily)
VTQAVHDLLLAELRRRITHAVFRVCPGWLASHAEDIAQTALLRVLGAAQKREGELDLSALYLEKAAYCATMDEIRRHRRRREEQATEEQVLQLPTVHSTDPETAVEAGEIAHALAQCLARLVEARRQAVTMHLLGHTIPETGTLLGWSAKRAENLVCRGLVDLRRCLTAKGLAR